MANQMLFGTYRGERLPLADARNEAGGPAYARTARQALAQYAATGCLNATFYADAAEQLQTVLGLSESVEPDFLARAAVFARERGGMKDMPALLCAVLSRKEPALLDRVFDRVIDNGRMLRTFVQIVRSGVAGRKSLGSAPKRLVQRWLDRRTEAALLADAVGESPSLADVIRLAHPKPRDAGREALYAYLLGESVDVARLPESVRAYEAFKRQPEGVPPAVPFAWLASLPLTVEQWRTVALAGGLQMVRMNLKAFARRGVLADDAVARRLADRLRDARAIRAARVLPYQLMVAAQQADEGVPAVIRAALAEAMEIAIENVPAVAGRVAVCPDVSGSMQSPVTGYRKGATSAVRCVDVAALVAAAFLRRNEDAVVLPFSDDVFEVKLDAREGVLANAKRLAALPGEGTNCATPLEWLADARTPVDLVVMVSDNQSWLDARPGATATMKAWARVRERNPAARLACLDIQPGRTMQAAEREDILNIGGFSDAVFGLIADFAAGRMAPGHWTEVIEQVEV